MEIRWMTWRSWEGIATRRVSEGSRWDSRKKSTHNHQFSPLFRRFLARLFFFSSWKGVSSHLTLSPVYLMLVDGLRKLFLSTSFCFFFSRLSLFHGFFCLLLAFILFKQPSSAKRETFAMSMVDRDEATVRVRLLALSFSALFPPFWGQLTPLRFSSFFW